MSGPHRGRHKRKHKSSVQRSSELIHKQNTDEQLNAKKQKKKHPIQSLYTTNTKQTYIADIKINKKRHGAYLCIAAQPKFLAFFSKTVDTIHTYNLTR